MGKKLKKQPKIKPINNFLLMAFLSVFQLVTGFIGATVDGEFEIKVLLSSVIFLVVEWIYLFVFYSLNWRLIPQEEHINHALIHYYAAMVGDTQDEHIQHCMCRLMMAYATEKSKNFDYSRYIKG